MFEVINAGKDYASFIVTISTHEGKELSPDFLMNGTLEDKSAEAIGDEKLLLQFRKVEKLPSDKKKIIKELLDAFIFKADLQKQLA
jgi:coenzyme F420-reducing hydrogenase beta subunit